MGLAAFRLTGCRQYARVDLRVDAAGRPYILEVNGNPDINPTAGLARQIRTSGMSYDEFVCRMVEQAAQCRLSLRESTSIRGAKGN